jgi:hypothetical protein
MDLYVLVDSNLHCLLYFFASPFAQILLRLSLQSPMDLLEEKAIKNPYFRAVLLHQKQLTHGE